MLLQIDRHIVLKWPKGGPVNLMYDDWFKKGTLTLRRYLWITQVTHLLLLGLGAEVLAGIEERSKDVMKPKWFLTAYSGTGTVEDVADVLISQASYSYESYIGVIALGRELWRYKDWAGIEVEMQAVKHFGEMNHWEFNIPFSLRWHPFPWDEYLDTSLAMGYGLSYATDVPELEESNGLKSANFMNYLLLELSLGLPQYPQWDFVLRLHHRSGGYGMFGTSTGSNFVCGGLKYRF